MRRHIQDKAAADFEQADPTPHALLVDPGELLDVKDLIRRYVSMGGQLPPDAPPDAEGWDEVDPEDDLTLYEAAALLADMSDEEVDELLPPEAREAVVRAAQGARPPQMAADPDADAVEAPAGDVGT